jgi:hypothetical protein
MDKKALRTHLKQRQDQLNTLINLLKNQGTDHPQYSQLSILEQEKTTVDNQLSRLEKLM